MALTKTSLKLLGTPVSESTTRRTPSGGPLCKSRISRPTRASVLGGRFSQVVVLLLMLELREYDRDIICQSTVATHRDNENVVAM